MDDLEKLAPPEPRRLTVAGRSFSLTPVRMGKLSGFSRAVTPVAHLVMAGAYAEAVTDHYEAVRTALCIASGAEPEWLDELLPDDFMRLCQAVVEVNRDFFVQRLAPLLMVVQAKLVGKIAELGAQSSPSSDDTAVH